MSLNVIPTEIFLLVVSHLLLPKDINSIAQTNYQFYKIVNPYLYKHNVRWSEGSALLFGWRNGQFATVQSALHAGADIKLVQYKHGEPLLSYPAESGNMEMFNLLLGFGANVNAQGTILWTPLFHAANSGHPEIVRALLARGVKPDPKDEHNRTPLYVASKRGHTTVVDILLRTYRVNPNAQYLRNGETPMWAAAERGHFNIVRSLHIQGAMMGSRYDPGLWHEHGLRYCSKEEKCLHRPVSNGQPEMIELLIDRSDVNPNALYGDHTPLHLAVLDSREDMVALLLRDQLTNPDLTGSMNGRTPLLDALIMNNDNIVALLLAAGANTRIADRTWLSPAMLLEAPSVGARYELVQRRAGWYGWLP